MKKTIIIFSCVLLSSVVALAHPNDVFKLKKNEIKVNLTSFLYLYPEVYYERLIANDQGLGASISFSLESENEYKFMFMPYYRFYFSKFFIEANAALMGVRNTSYNYQDYFDENEYYRLEYIESHSSIDVEAGIGFAVGYKYVNKSSGIVGEIYVGGGRATGDYFYPRVGVSIGKLF